MSTLYHDLILAGVRVAGSDYNSDLHCEDTKAARAVIKAHDNRAGRFLNQITRTWWLDVPFAYDPYWRLKNHQLNYSGLM